MRIDRIVIFRQGEAATAWLMFAYAFLAMTAYNIVKPVTRSKFISDLGADNLPYVQLASGLLIGVLVYFYGYGASRLPRRWVVPATQAGLAAILLAFWPLFHTGAVWVSAAFFVFGLTLGLLLLSQFWTLASDLYDARQARRLFGFIGGGASLGGAMGAGVTRLAVDAVGTTNLVPVSAVVLLACAVVVAAIVRREPGAGAVSPAGAERGVGVGEAMRLLAASRQLRIITLLVACAAMSAVVIEQQLNMAAAATGASMDEITRILAEVAFYLSLAGFVLQVGVTSRLHGSPGLLVALLLLPVLLGVTGVVVLLNAALWAPAAARVLDTSLRYSIDKTTREVLFLPLPADLKHRAKPFVDVTIDRFARAAGAVAVLACLKPWGLALAWPQLSYLSLAIVGAWAALALVARREYLVAFRRSLGRHEVEPEAVRFDAVDAETLDALVADLARPDEASILYAIDMLETLHESRRVPPALLQHPSARVRARALGAFVDAGPGQVDPWLPVIRHLLTDPDAGVRAVAARAVVTHRAQQGDSADFRALLVPLLHDADATVARQAIESARAFGDEGDALFVPALVSRLGDRVLKGPARETLISYGAAIIDVLAYVLRDRDEQAWVRRHVPATLARIPAQASMDALMAALDDPDGFLRYKVILAIETLRRGHPSLRFAEAAVESRVMKEAARYYSHLSLRYNLVGPAAAGQDSLLVRALDDKLARAQDRIFRLLGLRYAWSDIAAARYSLEHGDGRARAAALEYLDNLLGGAIRKQVMPILDTAPMADRVRHANSVLKSRPRDLADTLAQLVHDDDPVVAGAALHFVAARGLIGPMRDDLAYIRDHAAEPFLRDAAAWLLAPSIGPNGEPAALPTIELANRLRAIPLFAFVSVDEVFRVALAARQVRRARGDLLYRQGLPADEVLFLLEGAVRVTGGDPAPAIVSSPTAVNFSDVLEGRALRHTFTASDPVVGVAVGAATFLTMIADNSAMAQGLFRMLLASPRALDWAAVYQTPPAAAGGPVADVPAAVEPIEIARRLRRTPLFSHATADQLKDLVVATREVRLKAGDVLWDDRRAPAVYHVLAGEIRLEAGEAPAVVAGVGSTVGVAETLTGESPGRRAVVGRDGRALRLESDDLFEVLADHGDLLQGVFRGVIAGGGAR